MTRTAYLAAEGSEADLRAELGDAIVAEHGRLFVADTGVEAAWAANIWRNPVELPIASIKDGAAQLRKLQRNWALYAPEHFRRAKLIEKNLPHVSAKPLVWPAPAPAAPLGSWTLLAPDRLLASTVCSSPVPNGEWQFVEDREGPPNRAYLKLWEALTRLGRKPAAGELCLDLGASPGGWTFVRNLAAGQCLCAGEFAGRACRLAVLRHYLLPVAPIGTGASGAGCRQCQKLRLHPEVSGRNRPRSHTGLRRHPRCATFSLAPQQA